MAAAKQGREKRSSRVNRESDDGAGLVEQVLSPEELKERNDELISWLVKQETTVAKKKSAVEKFNGEIKLQKQRISVLTRELDTGKAFVDPQVSLDYPEPEKPASPRNDSQAAAS